MKRQASSRVVGTASAFARSSAAARSSPSHAAGPPGNAGCAASSVAR
ncbi:MAG: hypothetical protein M5U08_19545 [Burkholderiales bacterium]|nr:hypothetical protein [Burkholderiales bacterium]